jgi:hypothetical protein
MWIAGGTLAVILVLAYVAAFLVDEPIRRQVESQMNARLKGYSVRLGSADFHPINLAIDFRNLVVRQDANPDPPVADIHRLNASVEWRSLLHLRLVGNVVIDQPAVHVNLNHLQQEVKEKVPPQDRGWQDALEATYPLKINAVDIRNATVTYVDRVPGEPLRLHDLDIRLENIRNVRSPDRVYPSTVKVRGVIFDHGQLAIDGKADFLAEPHVGIAGDVEIKSMELDYFKPIARKYNVTLEQGALSLVGSFEYAPKVRTVIVDRATLQGVRVEYIHTAPAKRAERVAAKKTVEKAKEAADHPELTLKVNRFDIVDSTVGYVNKAAKVDYRVYLARTELHLKDLSNQSAEGVANAALHGKFMGSGDTRATASFRPSPKGPNFHVKLEIEDTDLKSMNEILRAHGGFDVTAGRFSLFCELTAKDGAITGYIKPLFKDVVAYDPEQDADKSFGQKLKERVIGKVSRILENRPREEVATVANVSGRLDNPNVHPMEVVVKLVQNAFFKAILPGFERSIGRRPRAPAPDTAEDPGIRVRAS